MGGRWAAFQSGTPLPAEEATWFTAQRVRDRFTVSQLDTLVDGFVPHFTDPWPARAAALVERVGTLPPTLTPISLADVQRDVPTP